MTIREQNPTVSPGFSRLDKPPRRRYDGESTWQGGLSYDRHCGRKTLHRLRHVRLCRAGGLPGCGKRLHRHRSAGGEEPPGPGRRQRLPGKRHPGGGMSAQKKAPKGAFFVILPVSWKGRSAFSSRLPPAPSPLPRPPRTPPPKGASPGGPPPGRCGPARPGGRRCPRKRRSQ